VSDAELRAAERAFREKGDASSRAAYGAILKREGRLLEALAVLYPELPARLRGIAEYVATTRPGKTFIVGTGQTWFTDHAEDRGVIDVAERRLVFPVPARSHEELAMFTAALGEAARALPGELDSFSRLPWRHAWTVPPAPFLHVERDGEDIRVTPEHVAVRSESVPRSEVDCVGLAIDDLYEIYHVGVVRRGGGAMIVAETSSLEAANHLAAALAAALGVKVE
jgi:hypothetical protein